MHNAKARLRIRPQGPETGRNPRCPPDGRKRATQWEETNCLGGGTDEDGRAAARGVPGRLSTSVGALLYQVSSLGRR
jgi:hypothetical protein